MRRENQEHKWPHVKINQHLKTKDLRDGSRDQPGSLSGPVAGKVFMHNSHL